MAIFEKNMAVGKSENLVTLHPDDLTQPFLRGCSDLGFLIINERTVQPDSINLALA